MEIHKPIQPHRHPAETSRPPTTQNQPSATRQAVQNAAKPAQQYVTRPQPGFTGTQPQQPGTINRPARQAQATPAQWLAQGLVRAEQAAGQILSFFFGYKKDRTEERKRRRLDDLTFRDPGDERKVEESAEGSFGGD